MTKQNPTFNGAEGLFDAPASRKATGTYRPTEAEIDTATQRLYDGIVIAEQASVNILRRVVQNLDRRPIERLPKHVSAWDKRKAVKPVDIRVIDDYTDGAAIAPAYTNGDDIFVSASVFRPSEAQVRATVTSDLRKRIPKVERPSALDYLDLAALKGATYHELSHILYSARFSSKAWSTIVNAQYPNKRAWNLLEDQRIETLFSTTYVGAKPYFTHTVLTVVLTAAQDGVLPSGHLWTYGRRYLPAEVRRVHRKAFIAQFGLDLALQAEALIDEFIATPQAVHTYDGQRVTKALTRLTEVVTEFANILAVVLAQDPEGQDLLDGEKSHDQRDHGKASEEAPEPPEGEPIGGGESDGESDDDAEGEPTGGGDADADADADGEGEADGTADGDGDGDADGDGEGEGDADGDADPDGKAGSGKGETEGDGTSNDGDPSNGTSGGGDVSPDADDAASDVDALHDALADAEDSIEDDVESLRSTVRKTLDGLSPIQQSRALEADATAEGKSIVRRIARSLEALNNGLKPGHERRVRSGRVNGVRWERTERIEVAFDRFVPSREESARVDVVILLDSSGSIGGNAFQIGEAAWAVKRAVEEQNVGECLVLAFDSEASWAYEPKSKADRNVVRWVPAQGSTIPVDALTEARRILLKSKAASRLLIVLTDGEWYDEDDACNGIIDDLNADGVQTVGVWFSAYQHQSYAVETERRETTGRSYLSDEQYEQLREEHRATGSNLFKFGARDIKAPLDLVFTCYSARGFADAVHRVLENVRQRAVTGRPTTWVNAQRRRVASKS